MNQSSVNLFLAMKKYFEASNRGHNTRLEISEATAYQNFATQNAEG